MIKSDNNTLDKTGTDGCEAKRADVLQANFEHYYSMAMDHHTKAGTSSQILLAIVGAILVAVGYDNKICDTDKGGAVLIMSIGFFGAVWAARQMERYRYWQSIALAYQEEMKEIIPEFKTQDVYKSIAKACSRRTYPQPFGFFFNWVQDRYLWIFLHLFVIAGGAALFCEASSATC